MAKKIFGVDPGKSLKPKEVRDAIVQCFKAAHQRIIKENKGILKELEPEELEEIKNLDIKELIRFYFEKVGGDFDKPTKKSLKAVCDHLRGYARNFRSEEAIRQNYNQIMVLINRI
ncbi:hypothetical protein GWN26_12930 [Candidatus Saccharibacteria bacterium]|nr:hypothetical protein [Candidatus Saccharibacteria bacterium]NIV04300.1 hypothetical protein [Calditrichia bacterium]NIS38843.1 hypothetical protein [Candidatus Saccharibacteria bacterium]NIV72795.1 hypothetical protein [Calditrichia bacterium]NIV99969.1 hypothetical protein [Candidatus Saccharibacteria bacterium]